jgi:transposase
MGQVTAAGLARREAAAESPEGSEVLELLTLDEKHYGRGQRYLTVVGDPVGERVWEVTDGREREPVVTLLETCLTAAQRQGVRAVALDLWQGFGRACREVLPQARLVYDRFHAAQELNHALDLTRRAEHARLRQGAKPPSGRKHGVTVLSGTRFWWLQAADTLPPEKRQTLEALARQGLETARVWECKEAFRAFFTQPDVAAGKRFLKEWAEQARRLENAQLTAVVEQFEKHEEKLLAYLETGLTNSFGEYLNGRLQTLRERARGFHSASAYRIAILFHLGKLDVCPQRFP